VIETRRGNLLVDRTKNQPNLKKENPEIPKLPGW